MGAGCGKSESRPAPSFDSILCDCDGVLVDTERLKFDAWREALDALGKSHIAFAMTHYATMVGAPAADIADHLISRCRTKTASASADDITADQLTRKKNEIYARKKTYKKELGTAELIRHVLQTLPKIKVAIVSGGTDDEVLHALEVAHIDPDVVDIVAVTHTTKFLLEHEQEYPNASVDNKAMRYRAAMNLLETVGKRCVAIEDTQYGIDAAREAGIDRVFAVDNTHGYTTRVPSKFCLHPEICEKQPETALHVLTTA